MPCAARHALLRTSLSLGAALLACSCDVSGAVGSRWVVSADVAPGSGVSLAVSSAESTTLAGAAVALPPGSLSQAVTIGIAPAPSLASGDWIAAGPAVECDPSAVQLSQPAQLAIPASLPNGRDPGDLLLLAADANGPPYVGPGMQFDGALLRFSSSRLGTFQAALGKACMDRDNCASGAACVHGYCRPGGDTVH